MFQLQRSNSDSRPQLSRRSVAKGAAWAVPVVAAASQAPALAASSDVITANVCQLFYGSASNSYQTHSIYWGISSSSGTIPAGTVVSYQVTVDTSTASTTSWNIPSNEYPSGYTATDTTGPWYISYTPARGTAMTGTQTFTVSVTFNQAYTGSFCAASVWTSGTSYNLASGATITIAGGTVTGGAGAVSAGASGLKYQSARRYPTSINSGGRSPQYFQSKSGVQTCYPPTQYSVLLSNTGFDNVTCYPTNTNIPSAARCTWGTTSCSASPTGLCTPVSGGVQSGQLTTSYC